jgi:hypothetical protein
MYLQYVKGQCGFAGGIKAAGHAKSPGAACDVAHKKRKEDEMLNI